MCPKSISVEFDVGVRLADCLPHKLKDCAQMRLDSWVAPLCRESLKFMNNLWNLELVENGVACWIDESQAGELAGIERRQESRDQKIRVVQFGQLLPVLILPT